MKVLIQPKLDATPDVKNVTIAPGDAPGDIVVMFELVTGAIVRVVMSSDEAKKVRDGVQQVMRPTVFFNV